MFPKKPRVKCRKSKYKEGDSEENIASNKETVRVYQKEARQQQNSAITQTQKTT